ncbi:ferredoxin [Streptomyces deccanensis]|uniref:ferredoxin n=1 Tax=Streptomyces deccanensis TaxID=424188 RepID=UPI001EFA5A3E|nr:ferredoxin [Streptomyces deccanensis]ULR51525.1 ferredoxin [Streptomyces deccanensis]
MRVTVDRERCEGHGVCEAVAPALFQLDDQGDLIFLAEGRDVPADQHEPAVQSVLTCPVAALQMEN